ncbi:uncharacterized protein [Argopecten irradians]|uniref:uncharacterized protein n=1 Tax=Argopecten irradians TaxID=31199 RepID=UPI00371B32A8
MLCVAQSLEEIKTRLHNIQRSISCVHDLVKRRKVSRSYGGFRFPSKHARDKRLSGKISSSSYTSTDEDSLLPHQKSSLMFHSCSEEEIDSYAVTPFMGNSETTKSKNLGKSWSKLRQFHPQKTPGLPNSPSQRSSLYPNQREEANADLEDIFKHQRPIKRKPHHSRTKSDKPTSESLKLSLSDLSPNQNTKITHHGSVKVLKPRTVETSPGSRLEKTRPMGTASVHTLDNVGEPNISFNQNSLPPNPTPTFGSIENTIQGVQRQGKSRIFDHTQTMNKRQVNTAVHGRGNFQQAMQLDNGQRDNVIFRKPKMKANTNGEGSTRSNHSHTQQQLENTERLEKPTDDKTVDDASLLHNVICEMEQRGEVNLETDGITDPDILSRLFTTNKEDETKKPENKIDFKTEQTGKEDVENAVDIQDEHFNKEDVKKQLLGETGESAIKNSHSDEEPNTKAPETWEAQTVTDSARKDDDSDEDVSDNASTVTSDIQESSLESGICFQPDVESSTMLKRVGLNPTEALVHVLNQNKKSIEDNSHEVKGNGIDTVLLLDASSSIDEKSFCQMKSACLNIVEFIESVAASKGIEENIALIVIGRNPMILQHLTIDYREMYDKIETIEPGGSSPMCIGTLLSLLELQLRGGVTSISRYQIPPRIILMTDGRPTDDHSFKYQESEFGMKSPMVKNSVLLAMDELRHGGYELVCVPVGQAVNRAFIGDMIERAGGSIAEIDDLGNVKKHFLYHYTIAKVIQKCKETDFEDLYMEVIEAETTALLSSSWSDVTFTEADVTMMKTILEKSEELKTIEYLDLNLPPLGSRISVPEVHSTADSVHPRQFGTVILHKPTGTIKVEWDVGTISFLDFDLRNVGLCIVKEPRRLAQDSLIDVGVEVLKGTERGRVFLTTSNGYVKVRWDNGSFGRYRFGADGAFDLNIALESYSFDSYIWQYFAGQGCWATYHETDLTKIEKAFARRQKTAITKSGRIVFAAMRETLLHGSWKQRAVRRITVEEAIFM